MKLQISKQVTEEITIEVPVPSWFKRDACGSIYYFKINSSENHVRFTLFNSGIAHCALWKNDAELKDMIDNGEKITEAEFITAFHELLKRMYLAAEVPEKDLIEIEQEMSEWNFSEDPPFEYIAH